MQRARLALLAGLALVATGPADAQRVRVVADLQGPTVAGRSISDDGSVAVLEFGGAIVRYDLPAGTATELLVAGYENPSLSDDGTVVAVRSRQDPLGLNPDGGWEIFLVSAADGTVLQQATDFPLETSHRFDFELSGDASRIAVEGAIDPLGTNAGLIDQVFVIVVGAVIRQITAFADGDIEGVSITDDGSRVAFVHDNRAYWVLSSGGAPVNVSFGVTSSPLGIVISGDGSTIAYQDFPSGVFAVDLAGSVQFSDDPYGRRPSLTDDGTLYYDYTPAMYQTYLRSDAGPVLDPPTPVVAYGPLVSGDGSALLFSAGYGSFAGIANDDGSYEAAWALTNGTSVVGLTDTPLRGQAAYPSISPDGTRVALAVWWGDTGVYVVEPDGFGLRRTMFGAGAPFTGFTVDGESVVFLGYGNLLNTPGCGGYTTLYRVGVDGGGLTQLGECGTGQGQASFDTYDGGIVFDDLNGFDLWNLDSAGVLQNTLVDGPEPIIERREPRVDALGEWVVFKNAQADTGETQIWRSRVDGSFGEPVTDDPTWFPENGADISADGTRIVFDSEWDPLGTNADHNYEIFVVEYPAGTVIQVTDTTIGFNRRPLISGNGEWVWFMSTSAYFGSTTNQLYRKRVDGTRIERVQGPYPLLGTGLYCESHHAEEAPCYAVGDSGDRGVFANGKAMLVEFDVTGEWEVPVGGAGDLTWEPDPRYDEYDVLRGDLAALQPGPEGTIDLGDVVCLASDTSVTIVAGGDVDPVAGQGFFYLFRGSQGPTDPGSWGEGSSGAERVPATGDCP